AGFGTVTLNPEDVFDGSMPRSSVVRPTKILTLHSGLVVTRLCRLKREKRDEVLREIREFFRVITGRPDELRFTHFAKSSETNHQRIDICEGLVRRRHLGHSRRP